ncbi:hypothetical protein ACFV4I_02840 [Nocardiopsis alba]|uniref:hypothetical protein n=1 Tax=Nocardiopsis alba TaxID=53437 RepID=UPI00340FC7B7
MRVTHHTISDAERHPAWGEPGVTFHGADLIDEKTHPSARMTVGYARAAPGGRMRAAFPYDEVLVVTGGSARVHGEDGTVYEVHPGEVLYVPASSDNTYVFDEGFEAVYVAAPPSIYAEHAVEHA